MSEAADRCRLTSVYTTLSVCELISPMSCSVLLTSSCQLAGLRVLIGGSDPGGVSYTLLDAFNSNHLVDRIGMCSHMTHIARASEQSEQNNIDSSVAM